MKTEELRKRFETTLFAKNEHILMQHEYALDAYEDLKENLLQFLQSEIEAAEERTGRKLKRENEKLKRDLFKSNERWRKGKWELQRQVEAIVKINKQTEAKIEAAERRRTEECAKAIEDYCQFTKLSPTAAGDYLRSKFLKNPEQ